MDVPNMMSILAESYPAKIAALTSLLMIAGARYYKTNISPVDEKKQDQKHHPRALSTDKNKPRSKQNNQHDQDATIVDRLRARVANPEEVNRSVYVFLDDHGKESQSFTYGEIDMAARAVAAKLQQIPGFEKGDRVILCYPPGLDFAVGFWGCIYAGAVAIPIYPPYPGTLVKDLPKFHKVVNDSGARVVLTNQTYHLASKMATVKGYFSRLAEDETASWPAGLSWITTDAIIAPDVASSYVPVQASLDDIAFFQYSSGSTSEPKAVMISYRNLRAQLRTWESIETRDTLVSWLPSYHDMGLVGFTIVPTWTGSRCVSMSPISFIKDPSLWLRTASLYQATHICAPNFGYALVARKTKDAQRDEIDLSSIKQAICAAEPIREESLTLFFEKFSSTGFRMSAFNCGYGLAETTLVCTGQDPERTKMSPSVLYLDKRELEAHKRAIVSSNVHHHHQDIVTLVGCGYPAPGFTLEIVEPETHVVCAENRVGEIWVSGESVASGYWNKEQLSRETFHATIKGRGEGTTTVYLRTGDLGFVRNDEVYVTGRIKDLIIIRGRNVCPQDVELTVEQASDAVRPGCVAAFSIERHSKECLVLVVDVRSVYGPEKLEEIVQDIQRHILTEHQLSCYGIVLVQPRTIPKTTSGKIQRHMSRHRYLNGSLSVQLNKIYDHLASSEASGVPVVTSQQNVKTKEEEKNGDKSSHSPSDDEESHKVKTEDEIEQWLMQQLHVLHQEESSSDEQQQQAAEVVTTTAAAAAAAKKMDSDTPWAAFGMDSIALVSLSAELGDYLGVVVPPSAFFDFPTPFKLSRAPGLAMGELEMSSAASEMSSSSSSCAGTLTTTLDEIPESSYRVEAFPELVYLQDQMTQLREAQLAIPYLDVLTPEKKELLNYNTYNYLGLSGTAEVREASKAAIDVYGTSMSSSPIVGQTQINADLETELCSFFRAEASILFVGGWVTNVTTIDSLVSGKDLILCDALNHNSCVTGQRLSGATVVPFPHNDVARAEKILASVRHKYRRVLIVIEGVYSMDGDWPDLKAFVTLKRKYKCLLFLDEAHSFGTMGPTGRGLAEYAGVDPAEIDVRMGTMSKSLGSTGGFILGSKTLVEYLKYCSGGFVFSVGLTPANAASTLASLKMMQEHPERVMTLQANAMQFYDAAKSAGLDIGSTVRGSPVVVVYIGLTVDCVRLSAAMALEGVNVKPIVYPAVEEGKARLRFFISQTFTDADISHTIASLVKLRKTYQF